MFPNKMWTVYGITEDDFIEHERCTEQLKKLGFDPEANDTMVLNCHICPFTGQCRVTRENVFLGARTC